MAKYAVASDAIIDYEVCVVTCTEPDCKWEMQVAHEDAGAAREKGFEHWEQIHGR